MVEAYAGPLASSMNLPPRPELGAAEICMYEVDVLPESGGELITYTGIPVLRHVNACHELPTEGRPFWGHHPSLAPHVARFELGRILAVRRA